MTHLTFDYSHALPFIETNQIEKLGATAENAAQRLSDKTGAGNDYVGWLDLPNKMNAAALESIKTAASKIQKQSDAVIVIGIGGSYLGSKAAIEALTHSFYNELPKEKRKTPAMYFAGTNISGTYLTHLLEVLEGKDFSLIVISKSGTTTEPAIAFRILKEKLIEKYGQGGCKDRIFAITDERKGALRELANREGFETFVVPDNVGGRFSVLTPVGLLPIAVAGIDLTELMKGAADAAAHFNAPFENNPCHQYAVIRNLLYQKGHLIEILANYEPALHYISEWWKQLYGESEGKEGKGIFPAAVDFTADLHSMGQYIQDGKRNLFETVLQINNPEADIIIKEDPANLDGLNYLAGKGMNYVNQKAAEGTLMAHKDGGVPNLIIQLPELTAYHLGYLFFFFEKACAVSGYLLEVNPFDQPGVEAYKKNMFKLLGKPGM